MGDHNNFSKINIVLVEINLCHNEFYSDFIVDKRNLSHKTFFNRI